MGRPSTLAFVRDLEELPQAEVETKELEQAVLKAIKEGGDPTNEIRGVDHTPS